jgi:hypothetical protein
MISIVFIDLLRRKDVYFCHDNCLPFTDESQLSVLLMWQTTVYDDMLISLKVCMYLIVENIFYRETLKLND